MRVIKGAKILSNLKKDDWFIVHQKGSHGKNNCKCRENASVFYPYFVPNGTLMRPIKLHLVMSLERSTVNNSNKGY